MIGADQAGSDSFGAGIAIDEAGNRAAVGALGHDHAAADAGAVYVFDRAFIGWQQTAEILPNGAFAGMGFGFPIAVAGDGTLLAIGATGSSLMPLHQSSVSVRRQNGSQWIEEVLLVNQPNPIDDLFGYSIAIDRLGDCVTVGCPQRTSASGDVAAGSVYVFHRAGGLWTQEDELTAADAASSDNFGTAVAISSDGELLAIGASGDDLGAPNSDNGSVYVFTRVGGVWTQTSKLTMSNSLCCERLGSSVAIDATGTTILTGSPSDFTLGGWAGAAVVFRSKPSGWLEQPKLIAFNGSTNDNFGQAVALSAAGDLALVSAPGRRPLGLTGAGSIYAFRDMGFGWQSEGEYLSPSPHALDDFGAFGLAVDATAAHWLVAEMGDDTNGSNAGAAHAFETSCSSPVVYCTAKTNSLGCVPAIGFTGSPSATAGSGFVIRASSILNNRFGYLFYGSNGRNAAPFKGGALCVRQPLARTPHQTSGGSLPPAIDCSGTFAFDFNTWISSGNDATLFIGQRVQAQYWSRDTTSSFGVSLTDGGEFVVMP